MTDRDTELLRDRLRGAVPEPPDSVTEARPVVARARQARRRRLTGSVVGAAAAVALVASLGAVLTPDRSSTPQPGTDRGVATEAAPDPYGADPCPATLRLSSRAAVPVSGAVRAIRLCGYTETASPQMIPPDALVTGLDDLVAKARALPSADPGRCAAISPTMPSTALVLTDDTGGRSVFPIGVCSDVVLDARSVESERVQSLLLRALDDQRDRLGVPEGLTPALGGSDLCAVRDTTAPLDPSRDAVVSGVVCRMTTVGEGQGDVRQEPMPAGTLAGVRAAWAEATPAGDQFVCQIGWTRWYRVVTSAGDVFTMGSACGTVIVNSLAHDFAYDVPLPQSDPLQKPWGIEGPRDPR